MTLVELKRIKLELTRVRAAREEMELRIMEAEEQIEKLNGLIKIQEDKEKELEEKIKLEGEK